MWSLSKSHTENVLKLNNIFGQKCCWLRCCSVTYIEWISVTNCIYTKYKHRHFSIWRWPYIIHPFALVLCIFRLFLHLCWFNSTFNIQTVPYEKYFGSYSMFNWLFNWITLFRSGFIVVVARSQFPFFLSQFSLFCSELTHTIISNNNNNHV